MKPTTEKKKKEEEEVKRKIVLLQAWKIVVVDGVDVLFQTWRFG